MFSLSLTKRYIPAIILLTLFIIFSHILINNVVDSNQDLAKIINISGKQRMLSQRLIILAQDYYEDTFKKQYLVDALNEIKSAHKYLLTKIITKKLHKIYYENGLDKDLRAYLQNFDNLLVLMNPIFIKNAREESLSILKKLDLAVKEYERYSNQKLEETSSLEFYMMLATLFILLLEVLFIFRPAARRIDINTKKLMKNQEYEETVIESNNSAIIAIDYSGKITTYNKKAQEMFGWSKEEMIGTRNVTKIIPQKYKQLHIQASVKYLKTGISCGALGKTHELEGLKKDGTIFPINISFGSKYKLKDSIVVANILDISKEKKQQEMLVQQSKLASMGEMMQNIAHQWRQPLSTISTAASGMQIEKEYGILTDEMFKDRVDVIIDNSQFLSQTIEDFSNFFKKSNKQTLFLVSGVVDKVEKIVKDTFRINNITIYKHYNNNNSLECLGFENELSQVIINIFNNAKDILIEKDIDNKLVKVEIEVQNNKGENNFDDIVIYIYDNAGGIPQDILPKVFEPYFTTKHQSQGTGIGLHMSHDIIHNHFRGCIRAYNEEFIVENKKYFGACFQIRIPSNIKSSDKK